MGISRDGPNFLSTPIITGTGKATNFKFGRYIHMVHPNKSPLKISGKGAWAYPGTAPIFSVSQLSQGVMGKATNFKFCTHILSIDRNKSPLQISGKVAVGVVRTLEIFHCTHILVFAIAQLCCFQMQLIQQPVSHHGGETVLL